MSSHVTRHPACVETVQVVPTRDEVRITRFVEFQGTNRLACELVQLTWAQAEHVLARLAQAFATKEDPRV